MVNGAVVAVNATALIALAADILVVDAAVAWSLVQLNPLE